jgi:hypothetical protein
MELEDKYEATVNTKPTKMEPILKKAQGAKAKL